MLLCKGNLFLTICQHGAKVNNFKDLLTHKNWHENRIISYRLYQRSKKLHSEWVKMMIMNTRFFKATLCFLLFAITAAPSAASPSRLKDILSIEGLRQNQLVGYGLVVGLNGTGDTLRNSPFTEQSLTSMLERLGVNAKGTSMRPENLAAVMITAELPPFARNGTRIDVNVSSMGDASDLKGGTLIATALLATDGNVYAMAQGAVAVSGFSAQGEAASVVQGVPTNGRISNGAIVEREIDFELSDLNTIKLSLHNPDFTTARRIAAAINNHLKVGVARPLDPATVLLARPVGFRLTTVDLLTEIENLTVIPEQRARVVIDERTGIIVIGAEVRVNSVAIAQGHLTISISEDPEVSQPAPLSAGETETTPNTAVTVEESGTEQLIILPPSVSLKELVDGLNSLGVSPRDMISILQAIKASGAMQADIQVL